MDFDQFGRKIQDAAKQLLDPQNSSSSDLPHVRPMRRSDLDEVLRIIRLHDSDDYQSARHAFAPERFSMPEDVTQHFVLEDPQEQRVVAVSGYFIDDDEAQGIYWLGWTYVNPFFRGRGYGKVLMRHVEERLLFMRARKLYLSTSSLEKYQGAVGFYNKCGFIEEARLRDYFRPGEHKLILAKTLSQAALTPYPTSGKAQHTPQKTKQIQRTRNEPTKGPEDNDKVVFEF